MAVVYFLSASNIVILTTVTKAGEDYHSHFVDNKTDTENLSDLFRVTSPPGVISLYLRVPHLVLDMF